VNFRVARIRALAQAIQHGAPNHLGVRHKPPLATRKNEKRRWQFSASAFFLSCRPTVFSMARWLRETLRVAGAGADAAAAFAAQ